jgi:hypothetical protein
LIIIINTFFAQQNTITVIKSKMGGTCSTHGRDTKCEQNFGREKSNGKDHPKDLGIDGKIILGCVLGKEGGWEGVDWLHLA